MRRKKSKKINQIIRAHRAALLKNNPEAVIATRLIQVGEKPYVARDEEGMPRVEKRPIAQLLNPFRRIKKSYKEQYKHARISEIKQKN